RGRPHKGLLPDGPGAVTRNAYTADPLKGQDSPALLHFFLCFLCFLARSTSSLANRLPHIGHAQPRPAPNQGSLLPPSRIPPERRTCARPAAGGSPNLHSIARLPAPACLVIAPAGRRCRAPWPQRRDRAWHGRGTAPLPAPPPPPSSRSGATPAAPARAVHPPALDGAAPRAPGRCPL